MTFQEYTWYWYKTYRKPKQRPISQVSTESLLRNHIDGTSIADMELANIRTRDLQEYLTERKLHGKHTSRCVATNDELSNYMLIKIRQILISIFDQALREDLVQKNYAKETTPYAKPWGQAAVFTPDHQKRFLQACKGKRYYLAYVLFFYLGCRRSELLGLSWSNVDLKKNLIHIRQTLTVVKGKVVLAQQTKTRASIRSIPIPKELKSLLSDWRAQQRSEAKTVSNYENIMNLVFTRKDGKPFHPGYFTRNFKAMVQKLDFCDGSLHLHSTRHTWATNMMQLGISITDVQALGGWSRPDTLLNIYAHSVKESQRKAMKKLYKEISVE